MISISSVISLMILSLATYSYSAPIVAEIVNATVVGQAENVTDGSLINNLTLVQGQQIQKPKPPKHRPVGLSSSSSSEEGDVKKPKPKKVPHKRPVVGLVPLPIDIKENSSSTVLLSTTINPKRSADEEQFSNEMGERGTDEEQFSNEMGERSLMNENKLSPMLQGKRSADEEQFSNEMGERSVDDLTTESSTGFSRRSVDEEQLSNEMGERSIDDLTTESSTGFSPRSVDEEQLSTEMGERSLMNENKQSPMLQGKRSVDEEQFSNEMGERSIDDLTTESSTGFSPRSVDEEQLSNEMGERSIDDLTTESSTGFSPRSTDEEQLSPAMDERAMSWNSVQSPVPVRMMSRGMDESMFSSDTAEAFNKRAVGAVETVQINGTAAILVPQNLLEVTTEGFVSTTELAHDKQSSTWDYETTVQPVEDSTSSSSVSGQSSTKILTVIPGRISKTPVIINPIADKQVVQGQLSQGKS